MKFQFDPEQAFQLSAIKAVTDLFDEQPLSEPTFSIIRLEDNDDLFSGQERNELGIGNSLLLDDEKLLNNLRTVQKNNNIDVKHNEPIHSWNFFDTSANQARICPHFSIEMETGTGKTYVYLRTILELSKHYGFKKFVIVVPSVAIREGVQQSLKDTAEHFRAIYDNLPVRDFVYDAKKINRLREFATSNILQIAIINIDAFRKNFTGTEDEQKSNIIFKESDRRLSGRRPIEFIQAARPIVIIDEPQSVDNTQKAQEAIVSLNPLCTLRYSATHRNPYNLIYRLDPIQAFELNLVKQIVVSSASTTDMSADAFVRVEKILQNPRITAKLSIDVQTPSGPKRKIVTIRNGDDLFTAANERSIYRDGYSVAEIYAEPGSEFIRFTNGKTLRPGDEIGGMRDDIWRAQIKHTLRRHLEREIQIGSRKIKVLSLFFIDRVANYRDYDSGGLRVSGKFARALEEDLLFFSRDERYQNIPWLSQPVNTLHDGYFSSDKNHREKDTNGSTTADDEAYKLIMQDKKRLLSIDVPLRFIFSHSALREGWDNPNVFQICTLNESNSAVKKRQEIGRGLRLPVDADGKRVFDDSINKLYVIANESYEDFAKKLQTEYEDDCGITFGKVPLKALANLTKRIDGVASPIGDAAAASILKTLIDHKVLGIDGAISPTFNPSKKDFHLVLPDGLEELESPVIDLLMSYRIERHFRRERDEGRNKLKKEALLTPEFTALWDRIKAKTTYRVEFSTEILIVNAVQKICNMALIKPPIIRVTSGRIDPLRGGVSYTPISSAEEEVLPQVYRLPDILAYLQEQTDLTRSTIFRILRDSNRLSDLFIHPQRYMDDVAAIMKHELHNLIIDGIKYERMQGDETFFEWEQWLFKDEEIIDLLTSVRVNNSIYDYVTYDSDVELRFARDLDARTDIKLFMKLPSWFTIETPIGTYNPDWAIVKIDESIVYLVRETKGTRDLFKLRNSENDKIKCGRSHFATLGTSFDVATSAQDI